MGSLTEVDAHLVEAADLQGVPEAHQGPFGEDLNGFGSLARSDRTPHSPWLAPWEMIRVL